MCEPDRDSTAPQPPPQHTHTHTQIHKTNTKNVRSQRLQLPLGRGVHQLRAGLELVGDGDERHHDLRLRVEALALALGGGVDDGLDLFDGVCCDGGGVG